MAADGDSLASGSAESAALHERAFLSASDRLERVALRYGGRYARAVTAAVSSVTASHWWKRGKIQPTSFFLSSFTGTR